MNKGFGSFTPQYNVTSIHDKNSLHNFPHLREIFSKHDPILQKKKEEEKVQKKREESKPVKNISPKVTKNEINSIVPQENDKEVPLPKMNDARYKISEFTYANAGSSSRKDNIKEERKGETGIDFSHPMFNIKGITGANVKRIRKEPDFKNMNDDELYNDSQKRRKKKEKDTCGVFGETAPSFTTAQDRFKKEFKNKRQKTPKRDKYEEIEDKFNQYKKPKREVFYGNPKTEIEEYQDRR